MRKTFPLSFNAPFGARAGLSFRLGAAVALALFFISFVAGCAPSTIRDEEQTPQRQLIWPPPPEPARISFSRTIAKPEDIGANKGFFRRLSDFFLGPRSEEIVKPYGITVDSTGRVIVVDTALKRVHVFDAKKNKYFFIESIGDENLDSPIAAAVDAEDNIYVTDSLYAKVFVFSPKGKLLYAIDGFKRPTGIAVNRHDRTVYVADTGVHQIKEFDLKGKHLKTFGGLGKEPGEFNFPVDIFVDNNGEVYVADSMNYRVQIFDRDGKFLSAFGRQGDGTGDFGRPKGVSVDRDGNIYVADALFDTVQIFDRSGKFLLNFGTLGREAGKFWLPSGVFIDQGDKIYVSDSYNKRIQIFDYLGHS